MNKKILIVDDDAAVQAVLKRALGKQGFEILADYSGRDAVHIASEQEPQVILLDLNLPGRKGSDILSDLRANPKTKMIPVIFETGSGTQEDIIAGLTTGADDYLCKPFSIDELLARMGSVLRRCSLNLDANPLTKLPGSSVIEGEIHRHLQAKNSFSVLYVDLNDFKAYNDYYGAHRGDSVILAMGNILKEESDSLRSLVGHIGGDDFVVVTTEEDVDGLCRRIIERFDRLSPSFYDETDRNVGYITVTDRRNVIRPFSLVSVGIGVVSSSVRPLRTVMEISAIGAEVKGVAKRKAGSAYFIDRRTDGYNSPQKKEEKVEARTK